jgi:hypothetical protein
MNIFSDLKAKRRESRKKEIESQARQRIGIKDFDGALYFAYDGTPLLPIEDSATPKAMLDTLVTLRENYVKSRLSESCSRGMAVY